jgi:hypothetical protein
VIFEIKYPKGSDDNLERRFVFNESLCTNNRPGE